MAGSAADQLRALVEAAEREAAESRAAVDRVGERADELARRVDELAASVAEALAALREEIAALRAGNEAEPAASTAPPPAEDPATRVEADADDELIAEAEAAAARKPDLGEAAGLAEAAADEPAAPEGARLLALKMALDGRPRAETAAYLRDNFELDEPEALLDEVYARAEARK